ncbi:MAG TPA: PAS domain-containing protein [Ktedonobacteraceae bacterium]|nr:PAS domain-containing protein [Ktedonobacteraceae bacterium]
MQSGFTKISAAEGGEFRLLAESIPQLVCVRRNDGSIEYANQRWYEYTHTSAERLPLENWSSYYHPNDLPKIEALWQDAFKTGQPYEAEYRLRNGKTGEFRWFLNQFMPFKDDQGHTLKWFGTHTDIHERKQLEETLRMGRDELRVLAEFMPQLVWIARPDGYHEFLNNKACSYADKPLSQMQGDGWLDIIYPDDRQRTLQVWHNALRTGKPYDIVYRLRNGKTGEFRWFLGRAMPFTDTQGNILKWFGTATDIEEQKRMEEALRMNRDELRLLTEMLPQHVWVSQADGRLEYVNQQCYEYTEAPIEQVEGDRWLYYLHPHDREQAYVLWQTATMTGKPYEREMRIRNGKTGEFRWFLVRSIPVKDTYGHVVKWIGTNTDIHEAKMAEDITHQNSIRFRKLFQANIIGMVVSDIYGNLLEANDAFLRLTGYTRQDLLAGKISLKTMVPEKDHPAGLQSLKQIQKTGSALATNRELLRKDGSSLYALIGGIMLDPFAKKLIAFIIDLNEVKEFHRRKDEFLGLASHEMKTPLASLKLLAQYLTRKLRKGQLPQAEGHLTQMVSQIDLLANMVNDLVDVSKIDTEQLTFTDEFFDVDALIHQVTERISRMNTTHTLLVQGASNRQMLADKHRIDQVLTNIIENAVKYSPQADEVDIHIIPREDTVSISIRDYGFGIVKEQQSKIFERLYRVSPKKETGIAGLGMGLYISSAIVKHYGGDISVESEPGKGSTFTVSLPCKETEQNPSISTSEADMDR